MATSGSLTTTNYDGRYYKLEWERTATSLTNNTSTIKWTLSCAGGDSWYAERKLEVVIAGVTVKSKTSRVERKAGTIDSGTLTIKHNTDGTKNFTASVKVAVYTSTVNCTGSKAFSLTEIPRVSTITATSAYLGGSCTITISRKVSSYTHTLKYQFGDLTGTIVSKTSSTSYKWNIPSSFAKQMSTVASKNGVLICDTYSGSTLIGTKTCPFTVKVGSSNYPKAEIEVRATDDLSLRLMGHDAGVILGVSEMAYEVTASTGTGATIKSYAVTNGTVKKTTKTGTFTNATSDDFTAVVTDSRGLTKETNVQFGSVIKYIPLTNSLSAKMTADGVINFTTSGKYFKGSFGAVTNTLKVQYRYKVSGGTYTSWTNMDVSGAKATASYNLSGSITGLDYTKVYYFQTRAIDEVKTVTASAKKLNASPIFDWGETNFNHNTSVTIKNGKAFQGYATTGDKKNMCYITSSDNLMLGGGGYPPKSVYIQADTGGDILVGRTSESWYSILAACKAMTTTYVFDCTATAASGYENCSAEAHLIGNCLRIKIAAHRKTGASVGNITNEDVMSFTFNHGGKIDTLYRVDFGNGLDGGAASLHAQSSTEGDTTTVSIRLSSTTTALQAISAYTCMPANLKLSAYI